MENDNNIKHLMEEVTKESINMVGLEIASKAITDKNTYLMFMLAEIVEAFEAIRKDKPYVYYEPCGKPEGGAIEIADAVIRIFIFCQMNNIDLCEAIRIKREYNRGRDWVKEGKKF